MVFAPNSDQKQIFHFCGQASNYFVGHYNNIVAGII